MNRKVSLGTTVALVILSMALAVSATMMIAMRQFSRTVNEVVQRRTMYAYLDDIDTAIREIYADIDEAVLREQLASGYVASVGDPYADYLTADQYRTQLKTQTGVATDFGLETTLNTESGQLAVSAVHATSAAAVAGIQIGDIITAVNEQTFAVSQYPSVVSALKSSEEILLTVKRIDPTGKEQDLSFDLTASSYAVESVQSRTIGSVGYIRILSFKENTAQQLQAAVEKLQAVDVTGFIFDLRSNAGGVPEAAGDCVEYLMPRGTYARQVNHAGSITTLLAEDNYQLSLPSVTLVNNGTAGEAELFAGVLQEFALTTVIGEKTAGKAAVQEYFPLSSDSSAVKLTTSELRLITGGSWEGVGITPNTEVTLAYDLAAQIGVLPDEQDTQLQAALSWFASANIGNNTTTTTTAPTSATKTTAASSEAE